MLLQCFILVLNTVYKHAYSWFADCVFRSRRLSSVKVSLSQVAQCCHLLSLRLQMTLKVGLQVSA
jgi:hypothetical protein